jgi:hypothetical protein
MMLFKKRNMACKFLSFLENKYMILENKYMILQNEITNPDVPRAAVLTFRRKSRSTTKIQEFKSLSDI